MTYKLRLDSDELFLLWDLVNKEHLRLAPICREGVGLQAISADSVNKVVWKVLYKLQKHTNGDIWKEDA